MAVIHDVLAAGQLWPQDVVAEALDASHGLPSFLDRLTALLLGQLTPDQRNALEVALATGYWHPQLGTRPVAAEQLRPWLVPLERQWGWVHPIWTSPLRRELARSAGCPAVPGTDRMAVTTCRQARTKASGWDGGARCSLHSYQVPFISRPRSTMVSLSPSSTSR